MSGWDDESCDIMRHHATSCDITRHHAIGSGSGSGAGGVRRHSSEGVAEEGRGGGSGSGRQAGVGSGSGRRVGVGSVRGSPYTSFMVSRLPVSVTLGCAVFQTVLTLSNLPLILSTKYTLLRLGKPSKSSFFTFANRISITA